MKRMKTGLLEMLRRFSIKKRLNYSITFLVIFPIIMIIVLTHFIFRDAIKKNVRSYSEELTVQLAANMENEVTRLVDNCMELTYSEEFQKMVQNQNKTDWDFLSNYRLVTNSCSTKFKNENYVRWIQYTTSGGITYHLFGGNDVPDADQTEDIRSEAMERETPYFWYYSREEKSEGELYLITRVRKLSGGNISGTVIVGLDRDFLQTLYRNMEQSLGRGTIIFTVDQEGEILSGVRKEYEDMEPETLMQVISESSAGSKNFYLGGEKYLGIWNRMQTTGWYVLVMIPYLYIDSVSNSTSIMILIIGLVFLTLGLSIAAVINASIVNPLNRILTYTVKLQNGEFHRKIEDNGEDEIHQLAEAFNCTTDEIGRLMLDMQKQSEQKARLEFDALQAQINPHFLANTLNTISYLAQLRGMDNIKSISNALINILIVSMGKESKIITVEKEISYVKDYLLIQSYRYPDFYQVEFDIPEELMRYEIPKFILQPIVENAIVHGVTRLENGQGKVCVSGVIKGQDIHICVTDNGPGIGEEKLAELLNGQVESRGICGLGIKSVDQRLKLLFGSEYGIGIKSRQGLTEIELRFPADKGEQDEEDSDC
ncbi:MAG: sensor histidine kinase [Lachnospiraceae bacterium]|jgi:two-component system sensor histidine kinase YesM|nr:sensor histidine kinase [Lachnospiraceae bacterium]